MVVSPDCAGTGADHPDLVLRDFAYLLDVERIALQLLGQDLAGLQRSFGDLPDDHDLDDGTARAFADAHRVHVGIGEQVILVPAQNGRDIHLRFLQVRIRLSVEKLALLMATPEKSVFTPGSTYARLAQGSVDRRADV